MTKEMELAKHLYIFKIIAYYTEWGGNNATVTVIELWPYRKDSSTNFILFNQKFMASPPLPPSPSYVLSLSGHRDLSRRRHETHDLNWCKLVYREDCFDYKGVFLCYLFVLWYSATF